MKAGNSPEAARCKVVEARINMLTPEEIAELAEIRRKMEELQARYDALVARAHPLGGPGLAVPQMPSSANVVSDASVASGSTGAAQVSRPEPRSDLTSPPQTGAVPSASPERPFAGMKLSDAVIAVLRAAGQPLPFEIIFKRLQEGGAPLPNEKPMLAVRQVLYNQKLFTVEKNRFRLISG
ncbi:MAG: hypothetical protein N2255_04255 [Kiritimatiellae bacterium]|nr:hypothetical protein [Kiritimatiellia bacterium]